MDSAQRPRVGVGCLIIKDGKILFGKRKSEHGRGTWSPPGGKLDLNEDPADCAIRETLEETGLEIRNPRFATITNDLFKETGKHYITLHYVCKYGSGEPKVMEPDKCEGWSWFSWDKLPEPLFLTTINLKRQNFNPTEYLPKG